MSWPKNLVVASQNRAKSAQMVKILAAANQNTQVLTLADLTYSKEPDETGSTYKENAEIKAVSACNDLGEWCIADDAGLEIDFLNGEPGVFSKRFLGEDTPFSEKNQWILSKMKGVEEQKRGARYQCAVCLAIPGKEPIHFFAGCEGMIAYEAKGEKGFGYDPIFYVSEFGRNMAELEDEDKFKISHRGKVLRKVIEFLKSDKPFPSL